MLKENKHCCEEHVDIAIDEFLVENETFPNLEKTNVSKCDYCTRSAHYVLK